MSLIRTSLLFSFLAVACGIDQPEETANAVCAGPDCVDGGAAIDSADDDTEPPEFSPPATTTDVPDASATPDSPGTADSGSEEAPSYPVCAGMCVPDDPTECEDPFLVPELSRYESQLRAMQQQLPAADAGVAQDASAPPSTASDDGAAIETDAGVLRGSCQIRSIDGEFGATCWLAGAARDDGACTSSRDCAPGFGCVGPGPGQCMRFCCQGDASCANSDDNDENTSVGPRFCDERPLMTGEESAVQEPVLVPVCAQAELCDLADPFPCADNSCTCKDGKACTIVNQEGSTGCRLPGEGRLDEVCPCAPGFFCHPIEQACKQLCRLERDDGTCGENVCQAAPGFPQGWGLCQPVAPTGESG